MLTTPLTDPMAQAADPMAQAEFQSPPPPPVSPTWPSAVDGETTSATDDDSVGLFSGWPWWWWAAGGGGVLVLIIVIIVCVCCCCCRRRRKRRRRPSQEGSAGELEVHTPPADFRRMESSAAKRYLHNIASVFSWGSDFEGEGGSNHPGRPSSNVIYSSSAQGRDNIYANTQQLRVPATGPGPSSSSPPNRKSRQIYGNVC